jgi:hypothetical protein
MPTDEIERPYLCSGSFKPPEQFQPCAKCGHNLVDVPAKNKSTVRHNKRIQLQWEEDSRKVAGFLWGNSEALMDKKGNPTTKVPYPKIFGGATSVPLLAAIHVNIRGGYVCIFGCVDQITGKQYDEGK